MCRSENDVYPETVRAVFEIMRDAYEIYMDNNGILRADVECFLNNSLGPIGCPFENENRRTSRSYVNNVYETRFVVSPNGKPSSRFVTPSATLIIVIVNCVYAYVRTRVINNTSTSYRRLSQ